MSPGSTKFVVIRASITWPTTSQVNKALMPASYKPAFLRQKPLKQVMARTTA